MSVFCLRTDYDIKAAYGISSAQGLFGDDGELSLETALYIRNFWIRHLLSPQEDTFHTSYMSLPPYHRPGTPKLLCDTHVAGRKLHISWLGYECQPTHPSILLYSSQLRERMLTAIACFCDTLSTIELEIRQTCADPQGHLIEVDHIVSIPFPNC